MPLHRQLSRPTLMDSMVNRSHPFAPYLRGFWMFNEGGGTTVLNRASSNSGNLNLGGTTLPTWQTTQQGMGVDTVGVATVSTILGDASSVVDNLQVLTWEAFIFLRALSSYSARVVTKAGDGTTTYNSLMIGSSGDLLYTNSRATTILDFESNTGLLSAGNFYHLIATLDKATDTCQMYINGIEPTMALSQVGSGAYVDDTARTLCFANRPSGDRTLNGTILFARYYNMYCTKEMAWMLYSDPYALWVVPRQQRFVSIATGTAFTQDVAGALTSAGVLTKQGSKVLAGTLTDSGALTRRTGKSLAGTLTDSGALTKLIAHALAGTLTDSGALTKRTAKSLAGTLTDSGALTRWPNKLLAGTLTDSGTLTKQTNKQLSGALTSSGALATARVILKALAGTLTSSGTLVRQVGKSLAGVLTESGTLTKFTSKQLSGTLTTAGTLTVIRAFTVLLSGMLLSSGVVTRQTGRRLDGALTSAGEVIKQTTKQLSGALPSSGALSVSRLIGVLIGGTLDMTGDLTRMTFKSIGGVLAFLGLLGTQLTGTTPPFENHPEHRDRESRGTRATRNIFGIRRFFRNTGRRGNGGNIGPR